jgi:hypothetical protein
MREWTERLIRLAGFPVLCVPFMKAGCPTIRGNLSPAAIALEGRMAPGGKEFLGRLATCQARADFLGCPRIPSTLREVTAG